MSKLPDDRLCLINHANILLYYLDDNKFLTMDEKEQIRKVLQRMIRALRQPRLKNLQPLGHVMQNLVISLTSQ